MMNIKVSRYEDPHATGWAGYIQPEDRSWIAFIGLDGRPVFFLHRDENGGVLPDDPVERAACLKERAQENRRALYTGVTMTEEDLVDPKKGCTDPKAGEVIFPLGVSGSGSGVDVPSRDGSGGSEDT
jgi:hypothetical protein